MPSTSKKQANFMRAVAHSPSFAKKVGVSQKVGKDFSMADKKKGKYAAGGVGEVVGKRMRPDKREDAPVIRSPGPYKTRPPRSDPYERTPKKSEGWNEGMLRGDTNISGNKRGGKIVKKAKDMMMADKMGRAMKKKSADTKGRAMKFAAGGLAGGHKSADGVAHKGKTKGKKVTMNRGGYC